MEHGQIMLIRDNNPEMLFSLLVLIAIIVGVANLVLIRIKKGRMKQKSVGNTKRKMQTEDAFTVLYYLIILCCIFVFARFVVANTKVASGSMEPTLMTGDYVIFNRLAYTVQNVERGDIINFRSEEGDAYFSKRVVGIGGDYIEFHDGNVYINGLLCVEPYLPADSWTNWTECERTFHVPEGHVFVLGDFRVNSIDSRYFENPYISADCIIGKYMGTIHNPFRPESCFFTEEGTPKESFRELFLFFSQKLLTSRQ